MHFIETSETNIGHFYSSLSSLFEFTVDKTIFDQFISLYNKTKNVKSSFKCILQMTNQKIRLGNQQPLQGRLARET